MSRFSSENMGKHLPVKDDSPGGQPVIEQYARIGGKYQCQTCDEVMAGAHYDRENWILMWRCSEGHISQIKEFVI